MSEWKKVPIKDVCVGFYDGPHATPPVSETGGIFLGISNITKDGHFDFSSIKYIGDDYMPKWTKRVTPQKDDIVFSYEATLNLYAVIPDGFYGCLGRRMALIRTNKQLANHKYLFYYFFSKNWRNLISEKTIVGATVDRIPIATFPDFEIELPSLDVQNKIATILSRYDSLIENYQKQIKLLEESAQRLYKEWFIDLRFPEHENTKIVDGVPEGWEKANLGTLVEFKRGKTITKKEAVEGNIPVVAGGLEPAYYCNKSNTSERVITISASGANAGYTKMYFEEVWASDCSFADNSMTPYLHFIFCFLRDNKTTIDNMQKGSAQPHVYAKDINAMELCLPETSILRTFEEKVSKCFDTISSLIFQIRLLTEARDRLLPKLMSREIEV